jgi:hypothetical protein
MTVIFTFSSFVIGPALAGCGDERSENVPSTAPQGVAQDEHEAHHP